VKTLIVGAGTTGDYIGVLLADVMKTSHAPNVSSHGGGRDCGGCEGGRFVVSLTRL